MQIFREIFQRFSKYERRAFFVCIIIFLVSSFAYSAFFLKDHITTVPFEGGSWKEGVVGYPEIINPIFGKTQVDEDISALLFEKVSKLMQNISEENNENSYTLTLKENLLWSDKIPLTSDDVVFTIKKIQNPENNSPLFNNWQGINVERISELQVKFTLPDQYVFFSENLKNLRIIPKHIFENISKNDLISSQYALTPVVSGPYRPQQIIKKDKIISRYNLIRNPYYSNEKAFISRFSFFFYKDQKTVEESFRLGKIDGFGVSNPLLIGKTSGIKEVIPMSRYYAIFFNSTKNKILNDLNVRMALNRSIEKSKIINEVFSGNAKIIDNPVLSVYSNENDSFNFETAKEFLDKSKIQNITINLSVPKISFLEKTAEIIKQQWEKLGIKVNIIAYDSNDFGEKIIAKNDYEALLLGNILENPEDLFSFWHSSQRGYPGLNLSFFSNKNSDDLLEKIRKDKNIETRKAELASLSLFITNENPAIFLYSIPYTYIHKKNLLGISINQDKMIKNPSERFENISKWYVQKAKVIQ